MCCNSEVCIPQNVKKIIEILEDNGYEGFIVGGCVRDILTERVPHDFDITTNAAPEQIIECFKGFRVIETGIKHGTVTVVSENENIEVTTYRIDGEYRDNRHPENVSFTRSLSEDLSRRDFTVNAMAYCPKTGIVDIFNGRRDIRDKIIRCVGDPDTRFNEDGLRILRALRFASVLGFDIDSKTSDSIFKNRTLLVNISAERIFSEMTKIITGQNANYILKKYRDVLGVFIPELLLLSEQKYNLTVDIMTSCIPDKKIRYAVLCGIGTDPSEYYYPSKTNSDMILLCMERFKSDNQIKKAAEQIFICSTENIGERESAAVCARRLIAHYGYEYANLGMLLKLACAEGVRASAGEITGIKELLNTMTNEYKNPDNCFTLKKLKINGRDLMRLGISGKAVGKILKILLSYVIEKKVPNEKITLLNKASEIFNAEKDKADANTSAFGE